MQVQKAGTEPFVRFLEFETKFDRGFKFSIAALKHVERVVGGKGGPTIIRGLVVDTGAGWRDDDGWQRPEALVRQVINDAALLAVVQLHSAIDDFVVSMNADMNRWGAIKARTVGGERPAPQLVVVEPESETEQLERLCASYGWDTTSFDILRPVLLLFRVLRNCVAHRAGLASAPLVRLVDSPELKDSLGAKWGNVGEPPSMSLPVFTIDETISLDPRQVILALEAAHRACSHVNQEAVKALGEDGLVAAAAHYALLADDPEPAGSAFLSPATVVNSLLGSRYRIVDATPEGTTKILQKLDLWKTCIQRHKQIFGDPPRSRSK